MISDHDGFYYIEKKKISNFLQLRNELSCIKPKTKSKFQPKSFSIWVETTNYVRLPRMLGIRDYGKPESRLGSGVDAKFEFDLDLYDYQKEAVNAFKKDYDSGSLGGILNLGCGAGKTRISLACIAKLGKKTLFVVDGDANCDGVLEEIAEAFPDLSVPVLSRLAKDKRADAIANCTLALTCYKTLTVDFKAGDFRDFGLIVLDEVHMYFTEGSLKMFEKISRRYILGLSATVTKPNGLEFLMDYYVGRVIYVYKASYTGAPLEIRKVPYPVSHLELTKDMTYLEIQKKIIYDPLRMRKVCDEAIKYMKMGEKIIVIGIFKEELERYKELIEEEHPGSCALYYAVTGKKNKALRREEVEEKPIILAIRQMGAQSLNLPDLHVEILSSKYVPQNDCENVEKLEQLLGRVKRKAHKTSPIIVEFVDQHYFFIRHSKWCDEYYKQCGYKIVYNSQNTISNEDTTNSEN